MNEPHDVGGSLAPERVPVLRPLLPPADRLMPYLRRIDAARIYTNWGPLNAELQTRLAALWQLPPGGVVSASSGTAALAGAILALAGRATAARPLAMIPALTFVATATAAQQCGYQPCLVDVDLETWMLDPVRLANAPLDRVGLAIPVAAYGRSIPQAPWRAFSRSTGVPVVIDGAASFDGLSRGADECLGDIPVCLSFHATKCFATGEGGAVATTDTGLAERVTQALNFGFRGSRESQIDHINGKLSEYHAAIGLAELDGWSEKQAGFTTVVERYREGLGARAASDCLVAPPSIGFSYLLWQSRSSTESADAQDRLRHAGVGHRLWYGRGLHRHQVYAELPHHSPLAVTDALTARLVGIPISADLSPSSIGIVTAALLGR
jgi:dTDP-4-amino-4,6-dideoxygalactose transaminase